MDAPLVIMRREEVAELVREAVRDERAAILAELRLLVLPAATAAPHEVERLLTADEKCRSACNPDTSSGERLGLW